MAREVLMFFEELSRKRKTGLQSRVCLYRQSFSKKPLHNITFVLRRSFSFSLVNFPEATLNQISLAVEKIRR